MKRKRIMQVAIAFVAAVIVAACSSESGAEKAEAEDAAAMHKDHAGHDHAGHDHSKHAHQQDAHGQKAADGELVLQKTCPVMEAPINKDLYVDVEGKRIYVCCKGCEDKIRENPQKYIDKLKSMGEKPETL